MKTHSDQHRTLLLDVLPANAEHCGPNSNEVLSLLHDEQRHRVHVRHAAALCASLAVLLCLAFWRPGPPSAAHGVRTVSRPAPLVINRVNDQQLFALLKDTPAALVKSPDGTTRLLVLDQ
jgi:hypothetical protein